jgi:hypothetical protein
MNVLRGIELGQKQQEIDISKKTASQNMEVALLDKGYMRGEDGQIVHDPEGAAAALAKKLNEAEALAKVNTNATIAVDNNRSQNTKAELGVKANLDMDATAEKFIYQREADRENINNKTESQLKIDNNQALLKKEQSAVDHENSLDAIELKGLIAQDLAEYEGKLKIRFEKAKANGIGASSLPADQQAYLRGLEIAASLRAEGKEGYKGLTDAELKQQVYRETLQKTDAGAEYQAKLDKWHQGLVDFTQKRMENLAYGEKVSPASLRREYEDMAPKPVNPFLGRVEAPAVTPTPTQTGSSLFEQFKESKHGQMARGDR